MKLALTLPLLSLALPALAQIEWVSPSDPAAVTAVRIDANRVLCRGRSTFGTFVGHVAGSVCVFADSSARVTATEYEVAIGPGRWDEPGDPGAVIGGSSFGNSILACRFRHGGQDWAGWTVPASTICTGAIDTGFVSVTTYQLLYPFDGSRLLVSPMFSEIQHNLDQCLSRPPGPGVVLARQCSTAPRGFWELIPSGRGFFRLGAAGTAGLCLTAGGSAVQPAVACSVAERFQLVWADGGSFSIRGPAGVLKMNRVIIRRLSVFQLSYGAMTGGSEERFAFRPISVVARDFKVVSYNMMLLPKVILLPVPIPIPPFIVPVPIPIFPEMQQNFRAREIAKKIHDFTGPVDVIAVQEAFDGSSRDELIEEFRNRGYHFTSPVPEFGGIEPIDGGVFLVSRWPILSMEARPFSGTGTGFDFFSAKGVSYAQINKLGKNYHVFSTHLQADNVPRALEQVDDLRSFVNSRVGTNPANDAVIVAGDMNIDMESMPGDYASMLSRLNAVFPNPPRPVGASTSAVRFRWTADSTTNDIKRARSGGLPQSWLDYIFFSRPGALPTSASWDVREYETFPRYRMAVTPYNATRTEHLDLSDHSAVIGTFRMPYTGPPVPPGDAVEVRFDVQSRHAADALDGATISLDGGTVLPREVRQLVEGLSYEISVPEILASSPGCRFRFSEWSNGGAREHTFVVSKDVTKMIANYVMECLVTGVVNPPGSGQIDGLGWREIARRFTIVATPSPGFEFVDLRGVKAEGNIAFEEIGAPTTVTANFRAVGTPVLFAASAGQRTDAGPGIRSVPISIRNSGAGGAANVRIVEVGNIATTGGSGVASLVSPVPVPLGAVAAGGASAPATLQFAWPASVTRLRFTVRFTADGVSGSTTLNLIR